MPLLWLILIVLAIAAAGFVLGRGRAMRSAGGDARHLHSLPAYYGNNVAIKVIVPAMLVMLVWLLAQPLVVESSVRGDLQDESVRQDRSVSLMMSDVRRVLR